MRLIDWRPWVYRLGDSGLAGGLIGCLAKGWTMTTLTSAPPSLPGGMIPIPMPRATPPPQGGGTGGLSGAEVLRVIRQRLVLILFLWFFFIALAVLATWLTVRYYPKFTATSYIMVQSIAPANVMDPLATDEVKEEEVERLLQDQALRVTSPDVLFSALGDPILRGTKWFAEAEEERLAGTDDPLLMLTDLIVANPVKDSNFLAVSAAWKVQDEVAKIVNVVVDKYEALIDRQQKESIRRAQEQLNNEAARAKKLLDDKQNMVEEFRAKMDVSEAAREDLKEKLLTLTGLETEVQVDMMGKKTTYESLQRVDPEDMPITAELNAALSADPRIGDMERRLMAAEEDLKVARSRWGENHRQVKDRKLARDAAADRVQEERAAKITAFQAEFREQARRNFLEAQRQLMELQDRVAETRAQQQDMDQNYAAYERLQEDVEQLKLQYGQLVDQQHLIQMTLRQEKSVQIDVQQVAIEPKRRSSPLYEIWVPAGAVLGLALSVGLALLLEVADKTVRTPRDLQRQAIPVLATIPTTDDDEIEIARVETASLDAPHSITAEAFRTLRANLFFAASPEQQGSILVTSPSGGNGKTTIATNLAISIALSGRRVLLVDANFRRASLPRIFPGMREEGLSNILIGQAHLDDVVTPTSVPGLDVLSAGPSPPNPAELLGSNYLRDLIVDARARYDQMLIDGPPVLLLSEATVLAGAVDGVLLVCQYRTTSRGALQRTQAQLDASNARIFGAVLNRVETRAGGYFRKAYKEFYQYGEPEDQERGEVRQLDSGDKERLQADAGAPEGAAVDAVEGQLGEQPGADEAQPMVLGPHDSADEATMLPADDLAITTTRETPRGSDSASSDIDDSDWPPGEVDLDDEIESIRGEDLLDDESDADSDDMSDPGADAGDPRRPA